jgi:hypothetical protein
MTADNRPGPTSTPLQFDVAEVNASSSPANDNTSCKGCSRPIADVYYQVNGAIICASCRASFSMPRGTRFERAIRAIAFGGLAAAAGSLLYFAVVAITGFEFGIIAVAVGYIVGIAVRKGSRGRGGWAYQTLAIGFTYFAIAATYVPLVAKEIQKSPAKDSTRPRATPPMADTITISARGPALGRAIDSAAAAKRGRASFPITQAGTPSARPMGRKPAHLGLGTILLGAGALVLIAAVLPIAAGFSNVISLLIIAVALFEAWRLNRRVTLRVTGPYRLAGAEG